MKAAHVLAIFAARFLQRSADPMQVETAELAFYTRYLHAGMMVFDVGANVGEMSRHFARCVGSSGQVHAFEPNPRTFDELTRYVAAHQLHQVLPNRTAVGERDGEVVLHVYDVDHSGWDTRALRPLTRYGIHVAEPTRIQVPLLSLDTYCATHGIDAVDLLKIDVEGAELQVLQGANRLLAAQRCACVAFEFGQATFDMGNRPADLLDLLTGYGYAIRNVVPADPVLPGRRFARFAQYSMHIAWPSGTSSASQCL